MSKKEVKQASIRAKVLSVQPNYKFRPQLIVLIQKMSYTAEDWLSGKRETGQVIFDDFTYKMEFDVINDSDSVGINIANEVSRLVYGDIINFAIEKYGGAYHFKSLDIENENECHLSLDPLVERYGQKEE